VLGPGTYDIGVSSSYALSKKKTGVSLASNAAITLPTVLAGDLNNDKTINSLDWSIMSPKWNANDAVSDINKDSTVNSIDFSFMNKNWGVIGDF